MNLRLKVPTITALSLLAALSVGPASAGERPDVDGDRGDRIEQERQERGEARDHAYRRGQAFDDMYRDEFGRIDPDQKLRAAWLNQLEAREQKLHPEAIGGSVWSNIGPTNFAGRVSAVAVDPANSSIIYRGTAGGGVWKSTDGGTTWAVLTDSLGDLSIGAVAVAPSNSSLIYVGTGEGALGSDAINGIGFIKSTDAGATWGLPISVSATRFFDLSVHPTNANEIVAATTAGIQKSTDGGATWVTKFSTYAGTALARVPGTPATILATVWDVTSASPTWTGRAYRSTDSGETWSVIVTPGTAPFNADNGRMSIAISPAAPATVYLLSASAAGDSKACASDPVDQWGFYRSTDGGTTWTFRNNPVTGSCGSYTSILAGQGWYANTIRADVANALILYAGGLDMWKSTDGAATWSHKSSWSASSSASNYVHADIHAMAWAGTTLLIGDDGGINKTTDGATSFSNLNTNVVTRQYYAIAVTPANRNLLIGGAQDNGTNMRTTNTSTYSEVIGGDGFGVAAHQTNASILYGTVYNSRVFRSQDGGSTWPEITPSFGGTERLPFISPLTMDPNNSSILYTGSQFLYKTINGGTSWTKTSTVDLSDGTARGYLTKIAVAKSNSSYILTATAGTAGYVKRSTDGGTTWSAQFGGGLPAKYAAHVEFDPTTTNTFYVAYAGGTTGGRLFKTINGGTSFTQIDTGLPNFPVHVVRVDPTDVNTLYAGSDLGLYRSTDGGTSWARFGTGLPAVSIWDIAILPDGSMMRVGTHGRGFWELAITASTTYSISGNAGTTGATVTAGTGSATSDASSNFTIGSLAAGTYTVTPSKGGCTFSPASSAVTITSANATGVNFTASCGGVSTLFTDGFEAAGWSTAQVSGTAGAWTLAASGTHPVLAPHAGTKLAVFNSYTSAAGNQTRIYRATPFAIAGTYTSATLTFWMYHETGYSTAADKVQAQVSINGGSTWTNVGTAVNRYTGTTGWAQVSIDISAYKGQTVNLGFLGISAYGNDEYLDDVAVTASGVGDVIYTISGNAGTTGATLTTGSASATSDASSNYTIGGLIPGTYTVTPSKSGCTFSPASSSVTISSANVTGVNFTASCPMSTYSISGNAGTTGANVIAGSGSALSDASSNYTISGLAAGSYTVTPSKTGCTFSPASSAVTITSANVTGVNFTATCGGPITLFTDGFESTGWSTAQVSGTAGAWTLAASGTHPTQAPHGGTKLAVFNSYTSASGNQTRLYRSAGFAVAGTYTTVTLNFWMYHDTGYSTYADKVQAQVSTNGTTWTSVGTAVNRYTGSTGWAQVSIDLSAYKGQTVYLGFVGISAYGNDEYLDDATVTAQ